MSDATETPAEPPLPDSPPPGKRRWLHPLVTGLAGLVVGAGAVALAWSLSSGPNNAGSFTLKGALTLTSPTPLDYDHNACAGSGGYDDIVKGAAITVYDAAGKVVATGALGAGRYASEDSTAPCVFPVAVPAVPDGSKFYQVEVSRRGKIAVPSVEAKAGTFAASLG